MRDKLQNKDLFFFSLLFFCVFLLWGGTGGCRCAPAGGEGEGEAGREQTTSDANEARPESSEPAVEPGPPEHSAENQGEKRADFLGERLVEPLAEAPRDGLAEPPREPVLPDEPGVVEPTPPDTTPEPPPEKPATPGPSLGGCRIFPANNPWNQDISKKPVAPNSDGIIASIGKETGLHPDFGTRWAGAPNGIPYVVVGPQQKKVKVTFQYARESDPGPYPIPPNAPIEGGPQGKGDRHVLVLQQGVCLLYELFHAYPQSNGSWKAGSGAIFDLSSNKLRPERWTSADAAGLPILPGLVRYEEVQTGVIRHALRFTVSRSRQAYVHPATHWASSRTSANLPPMGMRVRLKASFNLSSFAKPVQVILQALKTYGMFVADNGSNWYISGAPNPKWNDNTLRQLKQVKGKHFEVVKMGKIYTP